MADGSSAVKSYDLRMNYKIGITESPFTFKQQIQDYDASRWELNITTVPLYGDDALNFRGFLQSLRGRLGMFYFPIPQTLNNDYRHVTNKVAGEDHVVLNPASQSPSHDFIRGTYFSVSNRLYMALEDYVSNTAPLNITPKLRTSTLAGSVVYTQNPIGTFRLSTNDAGYGVDVTEGHSITIACEEALMD